MPITAYPDGSLLTSSALSKNQIETLFQTATLQMLGILADPFSVEFVLAAGSSIGITYGFILNLYSGLVVDCPCLPPGTTIGGIQPDPNIGGGFGEGGYGGGGYGIGPLTGGRVSFTQAATSTGTCAGTVIDPNAFAKVRIGWQTQGQPGWGIEEDVCFIRCTPIASPYSQQHDITRTASDIFINEEDSYTRAWRTFWTFYGPNSLDNARAVRSGLIKIASIDYLLEASNVYVNPAIDEPQRMPEQFQGQWWERVDLAALFNELVIETYTVNSVASVEIKGYTKDGQFTDFTVQI